jgi:hypothetical protein
MNLFSWWRISQRVRQLEHASDYMPNNYSRLLRRIESLEDEVDKLRKILMPTEYPRR